MTIRYKLVLLSLAVAALLVSGLAAASYPAHAASSADVGTVALSAPAASSTQCNFVESLQTCKSTDPTVAYYDTPTGTITDCSFAFDVAWGDGASTTTTVVNPPDSHHLVGEHTYVAKGAYTIKVAIKVTVGTCTETNSAHTFTLLATPTPTRVALLCYSLGRMESTKAAAVTGVTTSGRYGSLSVSNARLAYRRSCPLSNMFRWTFRSSTLFRLSPKLHGRQ